MLLSAALLTKSEKWCSCLFFYQFKVKVRPFGNCGSKVFGSSTLCLMERSRPFFGSVLRLTTFPSGLFVLSEGKFLGPRDGSGCFFVPFLFSRV